MIRNKIKIFTFILVLITFSALPVFAKESRTVVANCPKCINGLINFHSDREFMGIFKERCSDGKYNYYERYEVTKIETCNICDYSHKTVEIVDEFLYHK